MEKTKEELAAELVAEQEATKEVKEEEVRASIIAEYGFDEVDDAERIDKLVAKEVEHSKKLSSAIGQKIKHRTEAEELRKKVATPQDKTNVLDPEILDKKFDEKFNERMEKLELEALDYSDEIKSEIKKVSKTQGISVKQAVRDPYIAFKISEAEKEQKTNEASISRTHKTYGKKSFSIDNPPEVDMSTEEGRKEWDAYKTEMKKQGY